MYLLNPFETNSPMSDADTALLRSYWEIEQTAKVPVNAMVCTSLLDSTSIYHQDQHYGRVLELSRSSSLRVPTKRGIIALSEQLEHVLEEHWYSQWTVNQALRTYHEVHHRFGTSGAKLSSLGEEAWMEAEDIAASVEHAFRTLEKHF